MRANPPVFEEVTISVRHERGHLVCAYVTHVVDQRGGQRSVRHSRHISGLDERLIDLALDEVRRVMQEDVLPGVEPF